MKDKLIIKTQRLIRTGLASFAFGGVFLFLTVEEFLNGELKWWGYLVALIWIAAIIYGLYLLFKKNPKLIFEIGNDLILTVRDDNDILKNNSKKYDAKQITAFRTTKKKSEGTITGNTISMTYQNRQETLVDLEDSKLSDEQMLQIMSFIFKQDGRVLKRSDDEN